jgi:Kef-type K+ transport system membrane component KefB
MHEPFGEFALLLLIAAAVGAVATHLKQPVLIAYIAVGYPGRASGVRSGAGA